ncbi:unnamed protein product [Effrenium voratum]|nr:unnamed protein product [Effrenium voratum]
MAQGGLFDELQQVGSHVAVLTGSQPTGATSKGQLLERIIQWRHFPKERALSMVAIPYGWRTGFRSQVGQYFASVSVLEPHPSDHRQLQATVGLLARNLATWAKAPLLSMANLMSQLVNHTVQAVVISLPVLQDADQKFYTVLTLRTCQGGWPLLPGKPKAEGHVVELSATNEPFRFWFRPEAKDFSLAAYLRAFLPVIGADIQVFESMNGEPLVPFQAVLQRSQWEAVSTAFQEAWRYQKVAYEKLIPGKRHTPNITENRKPRTMCVEDGNASMPRPEDDEDEMTIQVQNTFVHVTGFPSVPRKRTKTW